MKHLTFNKFTLLTWTATIVLTACSDPSPLEQMATPIIIIQNDSITTVEDAEGRIYTLTLSERTFYGTRFLTLTDTLK